MTLTDEMTAAAEHSVRTEYCDAERIERFLISKLADNGGFCGRGRAGEIYYTQFALMALKAIGINPADICDSRFMHSCLAMEGLELVDLTSLARCLALMGMTEDRSLTEPLIMAIEKYRSSDGGYGSRVNAEKGTIYTTFMAAGGIEDLGGELNSSGFSHCLTPYTQADGGRVPDEMIPVSMTPVTAAVAVLAAHFDFPDDGAAAWLVDSFRTDGGVGVARNSPESDLLSTAVTLHAIARSGRSPEDEAVESALKYVRYLCLHEGGFISCPSDMEADVEYTFYGMLALGELARFRKEVM